MATEPPIAVCLAITGIVIAIHGRRVDEQNRARAYDKGMYQGQPDHKLDYQQVHALRPRIAWQKF